MAVFPSPVAAPPLRHTPRQQTTQSPPLLKKSRVNGAAHPSLVPYGHGPAAHSRTSELELTMQSRPLTTKPESGPSRARLVIPLIAAASLLSGCDLIKTLGTQVPSTSPTPAGTPATNSPTQSTANDTTAPPQSSPATNDPT